MYKGDPQRHAENQKSMSKTSASQQRRPFLSCTTLPRDKTGSLQFAGALDSPASAYSPAHLSHLSSSQHQRLGMRRYKQYRAGNGSAVNECHQNMTHPTTLATTIFERPPPLPVTHPVTQEQGTP
mmetsp:Transcript_93137/g.161455  ORF Transcript_93137/g.161455 Transcript_93137/m.161455 type:complete len:125 (-) Transcript_93137:222-596(-)